MKRGRESYVKGREREGYERGVMENGEERLTVDKWEERCSDSVRVGRSVASLSNLLLPLADRLRAVQGSALHNAVTCLMHCSALYCITQCSQLFSSLQCIPQ